MEKSDNYFVDLPVLHDEQAKFVQSPAKRKIVRAGRRSGKTTGAADLAVERFLAGRRELYAVPTSEQKDQFWYTVKHILQEPLDAGIFKKSESECFIELSNTRQRIKAKTAWNADTLRGDFADDLILDEYQLMNEDAWGRVGAPMLLDNDGDALFIYTPPSLHSRSVSKATDPRHAAKLFKMAQQDTTGRWEAFTFPSHANPHISMDALREITNDMTAQAVRQEILAIDEDQAIGALWKREVIDASRVIKHPDLAQVVVGVDPSATTGGDEAGIITAGKFGEDYYILSDDSVQGSPETWAQAAITAYHRNMADCIVAEKNNGGEMVESVIRQAVINARQKDSTIGEVPVKLVWASRRKATRAEPISAIAEKGRIHHAGSFPQLEDELCMWIPGDASPNRLDAMVWAMTELSVIPEQDFTITYEDRVEISPY